MKIDFEKLLILSDEFYHQELELEILHSERIIDRRIAQDVKRNNYLYRDGTLYNKFRQAYLATNKTFQSYDTMYDLPKDLANIISIYTHWGDNGSMWVELNDNLNYELLNEYITTFEKYLNAALNLLPSYNNATLLHRADGTEPETNIAIGSLWEAKSFFSCTHYTHWTGNLIYKIQTKQENSRGRLIEDFSFRKDAEGEVLFMSKTFFEITDVEIFGEESDKIIYLKEL